MSTYPIYGEPVKDGRDGKKKKDKAKAPNRLVLCFDGTGNKFSGTSSDTNIVKLYQMCDRTAKGQFHYYQRMFSSLPPSRLLVVVVVGKGPG